MWREQARGCKLTEYVLTEEQKEFVASWIVRYREFRMQSRDDGVDVIFPDTHQGYPLFNGLGDDAINEAYHAFRKYANACIKAQARQLMALVEEMGA